MSTHSEMTVAMLAVLATLASGSVRADDSVPPGGAEACGKILSPAVVAAWMATDGRAGRLGCPVESEGDTATSVSGSAARSARFEGGEIIRHMSGPFAGKAFAVAACEALRPVRWPERLARPADLRRDQYARWPAAAVRGWDADAHARPRRV